MFANGRKDILESDDFAALHKLELEERDGHQYINLTLRVNPAVKHFLPGEKPIILLLTDGASQRMFAIEEYPAPIPAPEPAPVEEPAAPVEEPAASAISQVAAELAAEGAQAPAEEGHDAGEA